MHRKVVEKERRGSSNPSRKWRKRVSEEYDRDGLYGRTTMSRGGQYGWNCKELNDNLGPLKGYLRSCIGRHWDDVYSELKKALPDGLHADHIMQHVRWEIYDKVFRGDDGLIYDRSTSFGTRYPLTSGELYVDPETGIVRKVKRGRKTGRQVLRERRAREATADKDVRVMPDGVTYCRTDGIWYRLEGTRETTDTQGTVVTVPNTRQLNSKELRKLGLRNGEN